jgi:hypothetical protein
MDIQNGRKIMTQNLARYIQIARHRIYGTPLDEEARIEQQRISAIEELQTYVFQKMDISVRRELFVASSWSWDDTIGASVQFSVDDQSFFLARRNEGCHLFLDVEGDKVEIAKLPDQDRQQFTDHLPVAISDVVEPKTLP